MKDHRQYLDPAVLAKLQGLDLKARLIVEGYVSGLHRSPYHGHSVEFAEHREYTPGDDTRYVDWKVFGKTDRFFLKQYEEETNFACWFLVDTSESMTYRSEQVPLSKLEYAKHIAAALAYMVTEQQDAVGLATFDRGIVDFIEAGGQPSHLKQLFHVLEHAPGGGETAIGPILHDLAQRIRRRGLIVILSDLFDDVSALLAGLKHFRYRRHDVSVLQVIDPAEQDFPFEDPMLFRGLEGQPTEMADPRDLRKAYRREFEGFLSQVQRGCRNLGMQHFTIRTDQPLDVALAKFLTGRNLASGGKARPRS